MKKSSGTSKKIIETFIKHVIAEDAQEGDDVEGEEEAKGPGDEADEPDLGPEESKE